jgi:hypothetical protein
MIDQKKFVTTPLIAPNNSALYLFKINSSFGQKIIY